MNPDFEIIQKNDEWCLKNLRDVDGCNPLDNDHSNDDKSRPRLIWNPKDKGL